MAIIAPPWLALPVKGYGGIEVVLEGLIYNLQKMGVEVVLYGNGQRKLRGVETRSIYKQEQICNIHLPIYESSPILAAHLGFAINDILIDGNFDVIHDNTEYIGPQLLAWASISADIPPIVHTKHGPPFSSEAMTKQGIPNNMPYWEQLSRSIGKLYIVGISKTLMAAAPRSLKTRILGEVHNGVEVSTFPFVAHKKNYFYTLGRFSRDKAQHVAARLCAQKNYRLRMAGTVAGIETNQRLLSELANPLSNFRNTADFRYYSDKVFPYVIKYSKISYVGNIAGAKKMKLMSEAKALLFPIDWEEPFGMVVIEALACGTPVVAMNRGAMPEIIEHGVNGFLANNEQEFSEYMDRVGEIDPADCRKSVEKHFSAIVMAQKYLDRYLEVIELHS